MKNIFVIFLPFFFLLIIWCSSDNSENVPTQNTITNIQHSETGWELYSWRTENSWNYSIVIGTNRLKTYDEVTSSKILVTGEEKLKEILRLFPQGEQIMWIGKGWLERCWQSDYKKMN